MSNNNSNNDNNIHEFSFDFICEYFSGVERQGPGSPEATLKALSFIENLPQNARITDLGCGTGGQTITLAQHTGGSITAIDLFPKFIDILNRNAQAAGLSDRLKGMVGSMDDLQFGDGELDLIWSEGAIYNIGFERGLREWRRFLKPGGWIAVTEATWFTPSRPAEIQKFWDDAYPHVDTIPNNLAKMQAAGYTPVAHFILPEECWTKHFFEPQRPMQEEYLKRHAGNRAAEIFVDYARDEERLYMEYKDYYGYVFYIGQRWDE